MEGDKGWTLVGMVHTANGGGVNEPESWFAEGLNSDAEMLRTNANTINHAPCALGASPFLPYLNGLPVRIGVDLSFLVLEFESKNLSPFYLSGYILELSHHCTI